MGWKRCLYCNKLFFDPLELGKKYCGAYHIEDNKTKKEGAIKMTDTTDEKRVIFKGTLGELKKIAEEQGIIEEAILAERERILKIINKIHSSWHPIDGKCNTDNCSSLAIIEAINNPDKEQEEGA